MSMGKTQRSALVAVAGLSLGALLSLAFPPYGLPGIGLLALPVLLVVTSRLQPGGGAQLGFAAGLSFFGIYLRWLGVLGVPALVGAVVVQALFFAGFFYLLTKIARRRSVPSALAAGGLWAIFEGLRGMIPFGGFPWGTLGSSLHSLAAPRRLVSVVGTSGLSALLIIASFLLVWIFEGRRAEGKPGSGRLLPVLVLSGLVALGVFLPAAPSKSRRSVTIAIVQAGIESPVFVPADPQRVLDRHIALTRTLKGRSVDIVLWGEGVIDNVNAAQVLPGLSAEIGAPIAAGALEPARSGGFFNLVVATDGQRDLGRYAKQHPVPFGEYVPLRGLFGRVPLLAREIPFDMQRGTKPARFNYGSVIAAPVISFESTFASLTRRAVNQGAQLLQVHTNNSTFGRGPASSEHLSLDQMRAAELGVPVARSAITGISAVIDGGGRVLARMEIFQTGILVTKVRIPTGTTPYRRFGDWLFTLPLAVWGIAYLIASRLRLGQNSARDRPPRWAWLLSFAVVGTTLFVSEVILVMALTVGLFQQRLGLNGWLAAVATLLSAAAAVWSVAHLIASLQGSLKKGFRWDE